MVFYRKYRPQKISELDNEVVRENLTTIFSSKNSIHAFLFTGPKGLGKTSAARIVAKVINCTGRKNKNDLEPCNKCEQCVSITNGNNLDITEIDGASNRGIDEIRDLKEKINLAPFKAQKKVYIIDEVHMLTTEAFNALLKTLEEPPNHAVFILCTTESQKVPATIASRCFRVNFTKATNEELVRSMQRIVSKEGIRTDKEALLQMAALSDGSFRDAAKILEEIVSYAGKKTLTKDLVSEKYNIVGIEKSVEEMFDVFYKNDIKKGINLCHMLEKQGTDFKFFIEKLIDRLHVLLLIKAGVIEGETQFSLNQIRQLFELLSTAYQGSKFAVLPQIPLELAVIEWGGNDVEAERNSQPQTNAQQPDYSSSGPHALLNGKRQLDDEKTPIGSKQISNSPSGGNASDFFIKLINEVKSQNKLFAGVLRSCSAGDVKNGRLVITASSKFHKEKIEEEKNMKLLEDSVKKLSAEKVSIEVRLKEVN